MSIPLAVALGLAGFLAAVFLYEAAVARRALHRGDARLRLKEVLRSRGLVARPLRTEAAMDAQALAVRRCLACRRTARCDLLAATRDWDALRAVCPNTRYLDSLRTG